MKVRGRKAALDRKRLTITLKKDILRQVDSQIDGQRIRNRSHAIEYLLSSVLGPKVKKAFILAGGKGIKMRPFTLEQPKTMLPVKGRPLLEHIISALREQGIRDIIILVGFLGEKIREHFGDGQKFGVKISYVEERKRLGTAAPLRLAKEQLQETFLMIYGDVLAQISFPDLVDYQNSHKGLATLALTTTSEPEEYGIVRLHGDKIVDFTEKPHKREGLSHLIFSGISVLSPKVLNYIPKSGFSMLEKDVFPKLAKEGKLYGYPFEGKWYDVGTPKVYEKVLKEWKS